MKIVVINQKGRVGKTTVVVNLAFGIAELGKKVLLVDLDPQAHSSVIYCPEIPKENTVKDIFQDRTFEIRKTIRQAMVNGSPRENMAVIPSNIHLATTAEQITSRTHKEKILHNHLKGIEKEYDFILIDCPPTLGVLTVNAIYTAELILIPTAYSKYSLDGIADLFTTINEVKETKDFQYLILRNVFDARNKLTNNFVDEKLEPFRENLVRTIIRKSESINQSQMNEEPVFTFDPKGNGAEDFHSLAKEMIHHA